MIASVPADSRAGTARSPASAAGTASTARTGASASTPTPTVATPSPGSASARRAGEVSPVVTMLLAQYDTFEYD